MTSAVEKPWAPCPCLCHSDMPGAVNVHRSAVCDGLVPCGMCKGTNPSTGKRMMTHYFGDECQPPHEEPKESVFKDY